jgi:hypothetical protein
VKKHSVLWWLVLAAGVVLGLFVLNGISNLISNANSLANNVNESVQGAEQATGNMVNAYGDAIASSAFWSGQGGFQ